ncbi:hypothetical protein [Nocardia arizonensis]|uniref:hypothetical protein n=1 Tax=Nocardia arizonensis TaxID=1141647 RepID=UPI0006D20BEC|nr:hypothetical protein [Nocardia arizonensis]
MSTPTPRPNGTGIPLPGRHLPGAQDRPEPADPVAVRAEIDALLAELGARAVDPDAAEAGTDITRRAHILEQAHDVLVQALATVDKI